MFKDKGQLLVLGLFTAVGAFAGYTYAKSKEEEAKIALYQEQAIFMEEIANLQETLATCQKGML